jgi:uncharacterized protein YvpB
MEIKNNNIFLAIATPILFLFVLGGALLFVYSNLQPAKILGKNLALADVISVTVSPAPANNLIAQNSALPASVYLDVPFILQAPFGQWVYPFTYTCEEASVLMVHYYLSGQKTVNENTTKQELLFLVNFENKNYGFSNDTTAEQTAQLIRDYYGYSAQVFYNISLDDIKRELAKGNPVIVPASGRLLQNPNFTPPGPIFHMLVIKGYDENGFIVNDDGTHNGKDYKYSFTTLANAIHDVDYNNPVSGKSAMIIVIK